MPSAVLTVPGLRFGQGSKINERTLLLSAARPGTGGRFGTPSEDYTAAARYEEVEYGGALVPYGEVVAVGTEATRSFGGPEAVFAMLYAARSEAARECADNAQKAKARSAFDGTLRFGLAPKIGAALNDVETRDALFDACGRNWRECLDRPEGLVGKVRALWLQGTRGNCDEPEPTDARRKLLWQPWADLLGLGKGEARIRFIRTLHGIDPDLVVPKLPGRPPPGFPRTHIGGFPICATCNSRRGCAESLCFTSMDGDVVTLESALSDPRTIRDEVRTHALLDAALAQPRCKHGSHERVGPGNAKSFQSYFSLPGLGGFSQYREMDERTGRTAAFEGVAAAYDAALVREHLAHRWLGDQLATYDGVEREACRAARDEQAEVIVNLRQHYKRWTGRGFRMKAECHADVPQCNRRRDIIDNGRNHNHFVGEDDLPGRAPVLMEATYRGVAEVRRGARRVGVKVETGTLVKVVDPDSVFLSEQLQGPNMNVAKRADILSEQIAVEHRKYAVQAEARERSGIRQRLKASRRELVSKAAHREAARSLVRAISGRDLKACVCLCRGGGPSSNAETVGGVTALGAAVLQQDRDACSALQKEGVDLDYPSRATGLSALALACKRGDPVMVHHLLDLGVSALMPFTHKTCGTKVVEGSRPGTAEAYMPLFEKETQEEFETRRTVLPPLVAATSAAQLHAIDVLCEETERAHGPETLQRLLDQPFGKDNYTALHLAVSRRDLRTCVHLVKRGARTEVGDARGVSPSELAIHMQQPRLGDYLRRVRRVNGEVVATRKDQDLEKAALLQYARLERAIEAGQDVLDDKASSLQVIRAGDCAPDQETRTGTTALFVACHNSDAKLVHNLCVAGCDPNYANRNMRTALMAASDVTDLDCVLALLRHGADASVRDVACSNAGAFAKKRGAGPTTDLGVVLLAARDRGALIAVDAYEATLAYRRAVADAAKALAEAERDRRGTVPVPVEKDPRRMTLEDVRRNPEKGDKDTTWTWRLRPRDVPVAFLSSGEGPDRGVYHQEASLASQETLESLEVIAPVSFVRRRKASNFVEQQELKAQKRQKDRDDARDAADAAMAYLQTIRDPLNDLKSSYRAKYGDASTKYMVGGDLTAAREHSTQRYKGMELVKRPRSKRSSRPWLDHSDESSSSSSEEDDVTGEPVPAGAPAPAPAPGPAPAPAYRRRARPETPEARSPAHPQEKWFDAQRLEDDVLQRFLDGDELARDAPSKQDDVSDEDLGDEGEHELRRGELRHRDAFRKQVKQQRRNGYASRYSAPTSLADPWEDARGHEHFGIDVEKWRENLERLQQTVSGENDFAGDVVLPKDPPELEYAKYKCKRGESGEAARALRRLFVKQKRVFRRENRQALEGPSERELRMTEEQRKKFYADKPQKRSRDALEVLVSKTFVALADVEEIRHRPHVALYLRKRSLATHLRVLGPPLGVSKASRDFDKQLAATAELLQKLASDACAAALYGDLHRRYARSKVEARRHFAQKMLAKAEAIDPDFEDAARTPRDAPSRLLDDGVLPTSQRDKLRAILDARDDATVDSESGDELTKMMDRLDRQSLDKLYA